MRSPRRPAEEKSSRRHAPSRSCRRTPGCSARTIRRCGTQSSFSSRELRRKPFTRTSTPAPKPADWICDGRAASWLAPLIRRGWSQPSLRRRAPRTPARRPPRARPLHRRMGRRAGGCRELTSRGVAGRGAVGGRAGVRVGELGCNRPRRRGAAPGWLQALFYAFGAPLVVGGVGGALTGFVIGLSTAGPQNQTTLIGCSASGRGDVVAAAARVPAIAVEQRPRLGVTDLCSVDRRPLPLTGGGPLVDRKPQTVVGGRGDQARAVVPGAPARDRSPPCGGAVAGRRLDGAQS